MMNKALKPTDAVGAHVQHEPLGVRQLAAVVAATAALILIAALLIGGLTHPAVGAVTGTMGLVLLLTNPEVWANLLGARRAGVRRKTSTRVSDTMANTHTAG